MAAAAARDEPGPRDRIDALQGLRAVAALMVAAFHLAAYTMPEVLGRPGALWPGLGMGYAGVEVFFVLSGFIMVIVHRGDVGRPDRAGRFLWKRVRRIYPLFWIVLAATVALRAATGGAVPDGESALRAVLLLPDDDPIIAVAWTLTFEMLFYLVFALAILDRRWGGGAAAAWFAAVAAAALAGYDGPGAGLLLSPYNLLFLFGMAAAWGFGRLGVAAAAGAAALGAAAFVAVGLSEALGGFVWAEGPRTVLYGLGALGMVAGLAALDRRGVLRTPRLLSFLGDASYSIYLTHIMAMTLAGKVLGALGLAAALPAAVVAALLLLGATLAGAAVHVAVERPLLARLPRALPAPSRAATTARRLR